MASQEKTREVEQKQKASQDALAKEKEAAIRARADELERLAAEVQYLHIHGCYPYGCNLHVHTDTTYACLYSPTVTRYKHGCV